LVRTIPLTTSTILGIRLGLTRLGRPLFSLKESPMFTQLSTSMFDCLRCTGYPFTLPSIRGLDGMSFRPAMYMGSSEISYFSPQGIVPKSYQRAAHALGATKILHVTIFLSMVIVSRPALAVRVPLGIILSGSRANGCASERLLFESPDVSIRPASVKTTLSIRHLLTQTPLGCFMVRYPFVLRTRRCADCLNYHGMMSLTADDHMKGNYYCEICENYVSELV